MSRLLSGLLFTLLFILFTSSSLFAQDDLWSNASADLRQNLATKQADGLPAKYRLVRLNTSLAKQLQSTAPVEGVTARVSEAAVPFSIPLPEGTQLQGLFYESPILSRSLQQQLPHIKTYELIDASKSLLGRLTIAPEGITGLFFNDAGAFYISPLGKEFPDVHMVYYVKDAKVTDPITCGVKDELANMRTTRTTAGDCQLRTFRIAVAATGEYTTWAGSQANALAAITTTVNNINAIYQRDATIRFTLVSNNTIIFPDPMTDPYPTLGFPNGAYLTTNDNTIDANIGVGNYDVGIVFSREWNGGLAQVGSTCGGSKGRGAAGLTFGQGAITPNGPQGPVFDNTVAHEVAHQLGASHSFMATNGGCAGNPNPPTAMEPGGGSTIMAYAGVCAPNSYQSQSDSYFHIVSLLQMADFVINFGTCAVTTSSGNSAPTVTVPGPNFTIPISTPFALTAVGADADGNTLRYSWEQFDAGTPSTLAPQPTDATGPMFRSFPPTTNPTRTFPNLVDLVAGVSPAYEVLPSVTRNMLFAATVRDWVAGGGCTVEDGVNVTTEATAGPFIVTSHAAPSTWTANGTNTENITWNVANTTAAPVSCASVDILLSVDGGFTYPYVLAAATPNDGSHTITVPNIPTQAGRIRVQSVNNIFFNINAANITINSACAASGVTVTPGTAVTGNAGSPTLDLTLNPLYGSAVAISGTLQSTDTYSTLAINNNAPGACIEFSNVFLHDVYTFTVNVTGSYTFSRPGGLPTTVVYNLYNNNFNPGAPCGNMIASSLTYTNPPGTVGAVNITATLTAGVTYVMAVGTFSLTQPTLPQAYTINVTPPGGGGLFSGAVNPGAGFNYTYVVVNNTTGNIVAIDPSANLSNAGTFPQGQYTIYGLSYANTIPPATLNAFIGGPFTALQNAALFQPGTFCSQLSQNTIPVNILTALPAEMLPLKASKSNNAVLLKWGTLNEQNTHHFEVLRSSDGTNFSTVVGNVPAQGSSHTQINYSLTDQTPESGINYYRVKLVDLDGKVTLSNIAHIDMTPLLTVASVYPNPAKGNITLEYVSKKAGTVSVVIFDSKGATVQRMQFNAQSGRNVRTLAVGGFAKGIYAVQITDSDATMIKRFVKE